MTAKITPNTRLTTAKVPSDSVIVVIRIEGPAFFISFQIISVPIIRPKTHSSTLSETSNQVESSTEPFSRFSACGPMHIPAISQPRIEGSLRLEISFPATNAMAMATASRNRPVTKSIVERSSPLYL